METNHQEEEPVEKKQKEQTFAVTPEQMNIQIEQYEILSVWKSYRKSAAMVIFISIAFTLFFVFASATPITYVLLGMLVIYTVLGINIFNGKKWAIAAAITLLAIDKLAAIILVGGSGIVGLIWLLALVSLGSKAYKVETERKKRLENKTV